MKKKLYIISCLSLFLFFFPLLAENDSRTKIINYGYNKFVPSPYSGSIAVTTFDSTAGIEIFTNSQYKKAFFILAPHYSPQMDIASCGIASSVILLNTVYSNIGKTPPISKKGSWYVPEDNTLYGLFQWTESNFYNSKISHVLDREVVEGDKKLNNLYTLGVTLDQLTNVLNLQGLYAKAFHATDRENNSINAFRELVKQITANPTQYMLVNYNLNVYSTESGGHYSPVAAYDAGSDTVLILDTWAASNVWIWVKLVDLYKSMNTLDGLTYRGYILVSAIKA